jgi:hypothetical protein
LNGTRPFTNPDADHYAFEKLPKEIRAGFSLYTRARLARLLADCPEFVSSTIPAYITDFWIPITPFANGRIAYTTLLAYHPISDVERDRQYTSGFVAGLPVDQPSWLTTKHDVDLVAGGLKYPRQILIVPIMSNVTMRPSISLAAL